METVILTWMDTSLTLETLQLPFSSLFTKVTLSSSKDVRREWHRLPRDRHVRGISFKLRPDPALLIKLYLDTDEVVIKNKYVSSKLCMQRGKWSEILRRFELAFGFGEEIEIFRDAELRSVFQKDVLRADDIHSVCMDLNIIEPLPPLTIRYANTSQNKDVRYYTFGCLRENFSSPGERSFDEREAELQQMLRWSLRTRSIFNAIGENPISAFASLLRSEDEDRETQQVNSILQSVKISGISGAYASMVSGGLGTSEFM